MKGYSFREVLDTTGLKPWQINYLHATRQFEVAEKVGRTRIYSDQDIRWLCEHFGTIPSAVKNIGTPKN